MPRWSAAQMLSRIALGKPLKLTEWPSDMDGQILPAQLKLREAIAQQRISDVRGRRGPPGSKERIEELLSDSEFTLLVTPHGTPTVHPPHKLQKFVEKYEKDLGNWVKDLDNWVREIDFDQDEGEQAFPLSPAPCQGLPDRPPLRLVSGARSGEAKAPAQPPAPEVDAAPTPEAEVGPEESPPPATQPAAPVVVEGGSEPAAAPHPGGRPPVVNWEMVGEEVFRLMDLHSEFSVDDPDWNTQACLEAAIANFCRNKFKKDPGETTIRTHIHDPLERWRQSRSET